MIDIYFSFFVFFLGVRHQPHFPFRLTLSLLASLLALLPFIAFRVLLQGLASRLVLAFAYYLVLLLPAFLSYKASPNEIIIRWNLAVVTRKACSSLYCLFQLLFGAKPTENLGFFPDSNYFRDFSLKILFYLLFFGLVYFLTLRNRRIDFEGRIAKKAIILSTTIVVFLVFLNSFTREYAGVSAPLEASSYAFTILSAFTILILYQSILAEAKQSEETRVMEELFVHEKEHYEESKESLEELNRRTHDLKQRLSSFEGRLTTEEVASLKEAIALYDSDIKTGNEVLDAVLYEQKSLANKAGISLSCIADGSSLAFFEGKHLYSFFSNALTNAREAEEKLTDSEKKIIDLSVRKEQDFVLIEIVNYCLEDAPGSPDFLTSNKSDGTHHGYGSQSMRYIISLYQGNLSFRKTGELFFLSAKIPLPEAQKPL